ncbi:MAG: helix-turn-helix domain-containing protein [Phycisphaerales bacterium]
MAIPIQGRQISALRKALRLDVAQFAGVLGVHPSTVHRWEAAKAREVPVDGVAANVLRTLAHKVKADGQARRQAAEVGDQVAEALLVGGALVGLLVLVAWLTDGRK